jgi:hypothetical protein
MPLLVIHSAPLKSNFVKRQKVDEKSGGIEEKIEMND